MLKEIEKDSIAYVFYSRKLPDDQPRNCEFCGTLFLPGTQPNLETPFGTAHWRRTLCCAECQVLRASMRRYKTRSDAIKEAGVPGVKIDRMQILERDNFICYLCGGQTINRYRGPDRKLRAEMDHVIPLGKGLHHPDNLRCCCGRCNLEKGSKCLEQAISICSCGDVDFRDVSLVGTPATLDELISGWKQWVLPTIDEDADARGYHDPRYEDRWTEIYQRRIARLEAAVAAKPDNHGAMDTLGMAQSGYSNFLRRNGRTDNAVAAMLECILTRERVAILQPRGYHFLSLASSVFDLEKLGGDGIGALQRLTATLSSDWFSYVSHAIEHMRRVAEQRRAERAQMFWVEPREE